MCESLVFNSLKFHRTTAKGHSTVPGDTANRERAAWGKPRIAAQPGGGIPRRIVEVPDDRQPDQLNGTEIRRPLENSGAADLPIWGTEPSAPHRRTVKVERSL